MSNRIDGSQVVSPFQGILNYEKSHGIPLGWINYATSKSAPNGAWQRLERGENPLDAQFFSAYKRDLESTSLWPDFLQQQKERGAPNLPPGAPSSPPAIDAEELFWLMMSISRTPDPHMYPALRRLHESRQFVLGALSNTVIFPQGHPYNSPLDQRRDVRACFDLFVSSAHVGLRKPDPQIYRLALDRLSEQVKTKEGPLAATLKPEEVVFLDDIGENLKAAKAAGMKTVKVWLGRTEDAVKELEKITGMSLSENVSQAKL